MRRYISFLRGINMTGHNIVKMTDLLALYEREGFGDAQSYIQSGNIIFNDPRDMAVKQIASNLEKAIKDTFDYKVPVMIRTAEEISKIVSCNPFTDLENFDPSKMAVVFLREKASEDQISLVSGINYNPDRFEIHGSEIFIFCPNGFGKTKLYTPFFEKKMGVTGTARNWKTVTKLLEMAENYAR